MDAGLAPARQARAYHRHELHTLTYVTLDQANGGIVRNITHEGIGVQMVAAVRPQQQLRVRFELRHPRLRVETRGEVTWATRSGQCGIRFLDISPSITRQINEWIFGNLLEEVSLHTDRAGSLFAGSAAVPAAVVAASHRHLQGRDAFATAGEPPALQEASALLHADTAWQEQEQEQEEDGGLMVSTATVNVIKLPGSPDRMEHAHLRDDGIKTATQAMLGLDWLWQPLSGRSLIWTINTLVIVAALLLFALVFLSITGEPPRWPLATAGAAAIFIAALYCGFFRLLGGTSPGVRLARMAGCDLEDDEAKDARFR